MKPPPPDDQQILALLTGRAFQLARDWTGKTELNGREYQEVFTVTSDAVHRYVSEHGLPGEAWSDQPRSHDGLYMVETAGRFRVYYQERGIEFDEVTYASRREAQTALVNQLLAHGGAGLYGAHAQATPGKRKGWLSRAFGAKN
jgi:hypothetical protein